MLKTSKNFEYHYFSKAALQTPVNKREVAIREKHLFFFHGYGADALNVASLHEVLEAPYNLHFYFVEGPEPITFAPGYYGRAWWPLSLKELEDSAAGKTTLDFSNTKPEELDGLRLNLSHLIVDELNLSWDSVILAGFSQGAMLATDLYLSAASSPAGLLIFSGALINKMEWSELACKRSGQKIFLCHGHQDQVLPAATGKAMQQLLTKAGLEVKAHYFNGGHEISWAPIKAANEYLGLL
jgi:phospholipase/carboxylesterase